MVNKTNWAEVHENQIQLLKSSSSKSYPFAAESLNTRRYSFFTPIFFLHPLTLKIPILSSLTLKTLILFSLPSCLRQQHTTHLPLILSHNSVLLPQGCTRLHLYRKERFRLHLHRASSDSII